MKKQTGVSVVQFLGSVLVALSIGLVIAFSIRTNIGPYVTEQEWCLIHGYPDIKYTRGADYCVRRVNNSDEVLRVPDNRDVRIRDAK